MAARGRTTGCPAHPAPDALKDRAAGDFFQRVGNAQEGGDRHPFDGTQSIHQRTKVTTQAGEEPTWQHLEQTLQQTNFMRTEAPDTAAFDAAPNVTHGALDRLA